MNEKGLGNVHFENKIKFLDNLINGNLKNLMRFYEVEGEIHQFSYFSENENKKHTLLKNNISNIVNHLIFLN